MWKVYEDKRPHGKKKTLIAECPNRQKARQVCRNRQVTAKGLVIVHKGTEERWEHPRVNPLQAPVATSGA